MPSRSPSWPWWRIALWAALAGLALYWNGPAFMYSFRPPENVRETGPAHLVGETLAAQALAPGKPPLAPLTQVMVASRVAVLRKDKRFADFFQEWASARNFIEGEPVYTHQLEALARYYPGMRPRVRGSMLPWNAHPPASILLALPFAFWDYTDAHLMWNLTQLPFLFLSLAIVWFQLLRHPLHSPESPGLSRWSSWNWLPALVLFLFCPALFVQIMQGQFNLLLLALILGAWALDRCERPGWAGLLLGIATGIKLFPGVLFLYFLLRRRWSALATGLASILAFNALAVLLFGLDSYRTYVNVVVPTVVASYRSSWFNIALHGFWMRLFNPVEHEKILPLYLSPTLATTATLLSSFLILTVCSWASWSGTSLRRRDGAFALCLIAMVLLSPVAWDHYCLFLFLPLVWLWLWLPSSGIVRYLFWLSLLVLWIPHRPLVAILMRIDLKTLLEFRYVAKATPLQSLFVLSLPFYALVILFVVSTFQVRLFSKDGSKS